MPEGSPGLEAGAAALLFSAVLLLGHRFHPLQSLGIERRSILSFGGGMSCAYIFVHVMPELGTAREAFAANTPLPLRYDGIALYYCSLVGFLVFYGLHHFAARKRLRGEEDPSDSGFRLQLAGFCAYVCIISLLLVQNLEEEPLPIGAYSLALAFHLLTLEHELEESRDGVCPPRARLTLAVMPLVGFALGLAVRLPTALLSLLLAFVSGAVIINSTIAELPRDRDGRLLAFMAGGMTYGLVLLPLG